MTIDRELRTREHEDGEPAPVEPQPGPPASGAELRALGALLKQRSLALPPSYRAFLKLCNGVKNFKPEPYDALSLLSIKELMRRPHRSHLSRYPVLSRFQIARGESLEFIVRAGEPEVVSVTAEGDEARYRSFATFLKACLKNLRGALR